MLYSMKILWTLYIGVSVQPLHNSVDHIVGTARNNLLMKLHEFQPWNYEVGFFHWILVQVKNIAVKDL